LNHCWTNRRRMKVIIFVMALVAGCSHVQPISSPMSRSDADRIMAKIQPGMTMREIQTAIPHTAISPPFEGEHGGVWYNLTINEKYVIQVRVAHPQQGASLERSVINYSPRLRDRKTMEFVAGVEKAW
jgi:hypothetical protein